jgi:hypothetical protein
MDKATLLNRIARFLEQQHHVNPVQDVEANTSTGNGDS